MVLILRIGNYDAKVVLDHERAFLVASNTSTFALNAKVAVLQISSISGCAMPVSSVFNQFFGVV